MFKELAHATLYEQVADRMRAAILDGELLPGSQLPTERELGVAFGVGRTSIREAIRSLETQGFIAASGRTTARWVVVPTADGPFRSALAHLLTMGEISLKDLAEVRCALEGEAVTLAAQRRHAGPIGVARAALKEMASLGKDGLDQFDSADMRFHLALVEASGNRAIQVMMLAIRNEVGRYMRQSLQSSKNPREVVSRLVVEHSAILEAVRRGDGPAAASLVRNHVTAFQRRAAGNQSGPSGSMTRK